MQWINEYWWIILVVLLSGSIIVGAIVGASTGNLTGEEKRVIVLGVFMVACPVGLAVRVLILDKIKEKQRQIKEKQKQRTKKAYRFGGWVEDILDEAKAALPLFVKDYLKTRLQEAINIAVEVRNRSIDISIEIDRVKPLAIQLKKQKGELVKIMNKEMEMQEYRQARITKKQIEQIVRQLKEPEKTLQNLEILLDKNNSELQKQIFRIKKILELRELDDSRGQVEQALDSLSRDINQVANADLKTEIKSRSSLKRSQDARKTDDIRINLDAEVSSITDSEIDEMRQFLDNQKSK